MAHWQRGSPEQEMSQPSPPQMSPVGYIPHDHLPPLVDGCRYPHEISQPKPIPEHIHADVLGLLRNFYATVHENGPTLSEASRTTAPAPSIASTGTSMTGMTSTFSLDDQAVQGDRLPVPLDPVQKARKALIRKLKACSDCGSRRVMCKLWHHSFRDLLQSPENSGLEALVEWAIRFDAEHHAPLAAMMPNSARVATFAAGEPSGARDRIVDQANSFFDVPLAPPMPYGSGIHETTASLLDHSEVTQSRTRTQDGAATTNMPLYPDFSIFTVPGMFPFGMRDDTLGPCQYKCEWKDCQYTAPIEELILHFELAHICFQYLDDPFRIVCLPCGRFHTRPSVQCCLGIGRTMAEKAYGQYLPMNTSSSPNSEIGAVTAGFSGPESPNGQGHHFSHDPSNRSFQDTFSYGYYDNPISGASIYTGSSHYSLRSRVNYCMESLYWLNIPYRLFRRFVRGRRYRVAFTTAISFSFLFGHYRILSKLAQLNGNVSTPPHPNLPFVGVVMMSLAFVMHRLIVHVHRHTESSRCGSWLSRCALSMFNAASGRPLDRIEPYEMSG